MVSVEINCYAGQIDTVNMEKGEEPTKFYSRLDKIASTLTSLGVPNSEGVVNRNLVRALTDDYKSGNARFNIEMRQREQ